MKARLNPSAASAEAYEAMRALSAYTHNCGLEHSLLELVKMRGSQINGCAFCLNMHAKDARRAGESEERLYLLDAWREAPIYTPRERAALAWTEALTLVTQGHVPDEVYEEARKHFTAEELVKLTLAVTVINSWNRICIAFRVMPAVEAKATVA
jgi:AhpD family alkylhydroperoxidase